MGTTARQGGIWKRECVFFCLCLSHVGGGEGGQRKGGGLFSSLEAGKKKKKLFSPRHQQVRVVTDKRTGTEFAAKSIPKRLDAPGLAPERQAAHVDNIRREVAVLRRLRGTLNVVALEGAFEDSDSVHIVMVRALFFSIAILFHRREREREQKKAREREKERREGKLAYNFFPLKKPQKKKLSLTHTRRNSAEGESSSTPSPTARTTPR